MKVKAILIDLDGTLIDSIPLIMESDKAAIKEFGFKVTPRKMRELSLLHSRDIAYYLMDSTKIVFDLNKFIEFRRNYFISLLKKFKPNKLWFKDSIDFLEVVSKTYPIAIVTGSRSKFVNQVFDEKTLSLVKFIITSDDVEYKKPGIEPLVLALKKLRLKKEDIVFIGDSVHDGLMCQRLGVKFIAKTGGISTQNQLKKFNPVFVAKNFSQIKYFIEQANRE
mgnify:FL=1